MPEPHRKRTWGFRFSLTDAVALIVFWASSVWLHREHSCLWWILAITAGHFFLFCNIFRVIRFRELIWASVFLINVGFWFYLGRLDWFPVMACQLPLSVGVIVWEIKTSRYHGILANRWNSKLIEYLEGRLG
jgi:hypothetical protein